MHYNPQMLCKVHTYKKQVKIDEIEENIVIERNFSSSSFYLFFIFLLFLFLSTFFLFIFFNILLLFYQKFFIFLFKGLL